MTDITCASCGSAQPAGAALCAVCGAAFPRTGLPVAGAAPAAVVAPDDVPTVVAGTGRRFAAWVIDSVAVGVVVGVVLMIGLAVSGIPLTGGVVQVTQDEAAAIVAGVLRAYLVAGLTGLVAWVVLVAVEGRTAMTLGGRMLGLRTLDEQTYRPVGFWRAALRWLIVWLGSLVLAVGQFVVLASPSFDGPRRQGWHDKLARTMVMRPAAAASPATSGPGAAPVAAPPVAPPAPAPASAPPPTPEPAPTPSSAQPLPEPPPPAAAPAVPEQYDGETRLASAVARPAALVLDSGDQVAVVTAPTLVGRNPQAAAGETWVVATVADPTRSMSKTHAELYPDPGGLWVVDRGSTNGTVVSVPGRRPRIAETGHRVRVPFGATLHLGDLPVRVVEVDA